MSFVICLRGGAQFSTGGIVREPFLARTGLIPVPIVKVEMEEDITVLRARSAPFYAPEVFSEVFFYAEKKEYCLYHKNSLPRRDSYVADAA